MKLFLSGQKNGKDGTEENEFEKIKNFWYNIYRK